MGDGERDDGRVREDITTYPTIHTVTTQYSTPYTTLYKHTVPHTVKHSKKQ